jgi:MSHA biogenesis protein MshL
MTTLNSKIAYQTPFLGSIPLLGNLFKSKQTMGTKTELVILLRPIVVGEDYDAWKPLVQSGIEHARRLDPAVDSAMSSDP